MEESEGNSIVTSEGSNINGMQEYPLQATLEETNKLSKEKFDQITEKLKERTVCANNTYML